MRFSIPKTARQGKPQNRADSRHFIYKVRVSLCSLLIAAACGMVLTSCGSEKSKLHFKTSYEGVDYYRKFYYELKTAKANDMASIATDIAAWQELEDSVEAVIMRDTASAKSPHHFPQETFNNLHASVREEFLNRAMARPRNLQDVLTLKLEANRLAKEQKIVDAVKTATPFFLSLDSVSIYNMGCAQLVDRYQRYLHAVERQGIHTKEQFLVFMREEDRLFRSFITHLSEMDGTSATDITKTTERIYAQLSRDAAGSFVSQDDLYLYLTMRTNRRMLVNAQGCLADIKASKVKTDDQRQAYLMMLLQPFSVMNDFNIALLTDAQKSTFAQIAKEASPLLVRLAGHTKDEREHVATLPDLMVKIYISSL